MIKIPLLPSKRPGTGWIPNAPDARDYDARLLNLLDANRAKVDLRRHLPIGLNQGSAPFCVGNGVAASLYACESFVGIPPVLPSRLFLQYNARAWHTTDPVQYTGTTIRNCVAALAYFGAPDEGEWAYSTARRTANRQPPFRAYAAGFGRRGGVYHTIKDTGQDRVRMLKAAIAAGMFPFFGTELDAAFMSRTGTSPIARPGGPTGVRHLLTLAGYRETSTETQFLVFNPWGDNWREDGFAWFEESYITWSHSRDFTINYGWDRIRKARGA